MPDGSTLHRSTRYQIGLPVSYKTRLDGKPGAKTGSGQTRDVSTTGASLVLPEPLTPGITIQLILQFETNSLALEADVLWVRRPSLPDGGTLHGVTFSLIALDKQQTLQALLQREGSVRSRIGMTRPVPVRARTTQEVTLLDLSLGGARIEHLTLLRPGSSCSLEFPPAFGALVLTARVVRSAVVGIEQGSTRGRNLRYESGLAFVNPTPDQRTVLTQLLERLSVEGGLEGVLRLS